MKTLAILFTFLLSYYHNPIKGVFLKKITIGKFSYSIYKEKSYSHDDNWNAEFFVVHRLGRAKELCSAYINAKRNDSTFIKGRYLLYNDKIEFTECFYYYKNNPVWIDSTKTTFSPNKYGDLILREATDFKNGKKTIKKY